MAEFVGLRPKLYCIITASGDLKATAKGTSKAAKQRHLKLENYKHVLNTGAVARLKNTSFRSNNHKINTIVQNKIALSAFDDKRYILDDGITSLPYGHYSFG